MPPPTRLGKALHYRPAGSFHFADTPNPPVTSTMTREVFEESVRIVKDYIRAGDAYQVVLSQRLAAPFEGDPFGLYRALRLNQPVPVPLLPAPPRRDGGRLVTRTHDQSAGRDGLLTPDRRHPPPRRHRRGGPSPGEGIAGRSQGASRARHAHRLGPATTSAGCATSVRSTWTT